MKTLSNKTVNYRIEDVLDQVIKTGKPMFIKRKGKIIKIDLKKGLSRTERLFSKPPRKNVVKGDSEDLVHFKAWEWQK